MIIAYLDWEFTIKKYIHMALASVAPWTERRLANQGVASLNPNQGTCLGPQWGVHERQPHADVSLPLISLCLWK